MQSGAPIQMAGRGEVNEVAPQNEGERLGSCGGRGRGGGLRGPSSSYLTCVFHDGNHQQ